MPAIINLDGSATAYDLSISPFTGWQHGRVDASAIAHVASFARRSCHLSGWVDLSPFRDPTRTTFAVAHEIRVNPAYESRFIQVTDKCYAVCTVAHVGSSSSVFLTKVYLSPKKGPFLTNPPTAEQLKQKDYHDWIVAGANGEVVTDGPLPTSPVSAADVYCDTGKPVELGMSCLTMVYISTITRKSVPLTDALRNLMLSGANNKEMFAEWKTRGNNDRLKIDFGLMRRSGDKLFSALETCALVFSATAAHVHDGDDGQKAVADTTKKDGFVSVAHNDDAADSSPVFVPIPITNGTISTSNNNTLADHAAHTGPSISSHTNLRAVVGGGAFSPLSPAIITSLKSLTATATSKPIKHMAIFTSRRALRPADFDFNLHMNMNMYVSAVIDALKYAMRDFLDLQRKQTALAKQRGSGGSNTPTDESADAHQRGTPIVALDHQFPVVAIDADEANPEAGGKYTVHHLGEVLGRLGYQSVVSKFTNRSHQNRPDKKARQQHENEAHHQQEEQQQQQHPVQDYLSRQTTEVDYNASSTTAVNTNGSSSATTTPKRDAYDMTRFVSVEECVVTSRIEYLKEVTELTSELEVTVMIAPPITTTTTGGEDSGGSYFSVDPETLRVSHGNGPNARIPIQYQVRCIPPSWVEDPTPYIASSGEVVLRRVEDLSVFMPSLRGRTIQKGEEAGKKA